MCEDIIEDLSFKDDKFLLDFETFYQLPTRQNDRVLLLADALPPKLFLNKFFFENQNKCKGHSNEFHKIEEVENHLVMFRRGNRHVSEIMYFTPYVLRYNYQEPMRRLKHRLRAIRKGQHLLVSTQNFKNWCLYSASIPKCFIDFYFSGETFSENYKVHLFLSLLFRFWVIVWTAFGK